MTSEKVLDGVLRVMMASSCHTVRMAVQIQRGSWEDTWGRMGQVDQMVPQFKYTQVDLPGK